MTILNIWNSNTQISISDSRFEELRYIKWYLDTNGYAWTKVDKVLKYLHHFILPKLDGMRVDHIDQDKLNCQDENLRYATVSQNALNSKLRITNTSGYRGVRLHTYSGKYIAEIRVHPRRKYLGSFNTAEEAALAYNKAADFLHGEFAQLNEIKRKLEEE